MTLSSIAPFRKCKNKISGFSVTFLRLRIVAGLFECRQRRKSTSNKLLDGPFPTFEGGRGSAIAKKLQKEQDFCFQNEWAAATRGLCRNKVLAVRDHICKECAKLFGSEGSLPIRCPPTAQSKSALAARWRPRTPADRPECQPAALRSRRREPGAKGPL